MSRLLKESCITCAVTIVENNYNKILLTQRHKSLTNFPGEWCFPGGKLDVNETPEEAARRETYEEVNLICRSLSNFGIYKTTDSTTGNSFMIHAFKVLSWTGNASIDRSNTEIESFKWIAPELALDTLQIAGIATTTILQKLAARNID